MSLEKITSSRKATKKRQFHDACGMAHGMELVGDRWALFVVRELMFGPRRFSDLRADLPGISANVLTQRLQELEENNIVRRTRLPPPASVQVYELTEWGYEAEPVVIELGRWAARSPQHDPSLPLSGVSVLLSFRAMIQRDRIGDLVLSVGFRFGEDEYLARIDAAGIAVARGSADEGDIVLAGAPDALASYVYRGLAVEELSASGGLAISGDPALAERFRNLFGLPRRFEPPEDR